MKSVTVSLALLLSLAAFAQDDEFTATIIGDKEAFLSSKTGEYVFRGHDSTDVSKLKTTDKGVVYTKTIVHTIKKGETLSSIAKKLGVTVSELKSENKVSATALKIGQELKLTRNLVLKSSSPVISQEEGRIIARLAPGQTPDNMRPPDLPPDAMPGSTINLAVEEDVNAIKEKGIETTSEASDVDVSQLSEDGILTHTVKGGETLFSIARKYKVSMKDLKEANNLALNNLRVGQKLEVKIHNPDMFRTQTSEERKVAPEEVAKAVEKGDNKERNIAAKTSTPIEAVKNDKEEVIDGLIKKYAKKVKTDKPEEGHTIHVVKKGETLWAISKKYNMTVNELIELNSLKSNDLGIGQELKVKK